MSSKQDIPNIFMKRENAIMLSVAMLIIGFIGGVAFGVIKSHKMSESKSQISSEPIPNMIPKLEEAAANNPKNADVWTKLGNAFFDTNQYEKAIRAYEKSLAIEPDNPNVLTDLGIMYRLNKQPEKAVELFSKAISIAPAHEFSRMNKGIVLMYDLKDEKGAIQAWEELLAINPLFMFQDGQSLDQVIKHYKESKKNK